jgi:muconolactone D-isomerase
LKFLVKIEVDLPPSLSAEERDALLRAELARGRELKRAGSIAEIWRIPGGLRNVGIWEAVDATKLHELLVSLPLFPYINAEVVPLATHPIDDAE